MAYRNLEYKPVPRPVRRNVQSTSVAGEIYMQNGVIAYFGFPCWYLDAVPPKHPQIHDTTHHDYWGHPEPRRPDRSCQIVQGHHIVGQEPHDTLLELAKTWPIHLSEEGYGRVDVIFDNPPSGLKAEGFIDEVDDWIIRVKIMAALTDAVNKQVDIPYAIFLAGTSEIDGDFEKEFRDIAARGVLHVLPGPINEAWARG